MKRFWATPLVAVFSLLLSTGNSAAHEQQLYCGRQHALLAPADSSAHRKYAPDRAIDVLHLTLDVTPDFKERQRRAQRGVEILDRLEDVRRGLLMGAVPKDKLADLARMVREKRERGADPVVSRLLDEIELRAEIELAKLSRKLA